MKKGNVRTDVDPRVMAQLIDALFTGIWLNIIMGYDNAEVHETWIRSIPVIFGKPAHSFFSYAANQFRPVH